MTSSLIKYEAARIALAECKSFDEVKSWSDKAAAMQAYGKMAKDQTLELDASEIRIRAERRLGELLVAQKSDGGLAKPGPKNNSLPAEERIPTLKDAGISHNLSARAQNLAAVPEDKFEEEITGYRERVEKEGARVTARLDVAGKKAAQEATATEPPQNEDYDERDATIDLLTDQVDALRAELYAAIAGGESAAAKDMAKTLVADLQKEVKTLSARLAEITESRNAWQNQVAELKNQINRQRREIDKLAGTRTA